MSLVSGRPDLPASADCRTARPVSSLRVARKVMTGVNHLLGYLHGGLRAHQVCPQAPTLDPAAEYRIWRSPQAEYLDVHLLMDFQGDGQGTAVITAQAGTGSSEQHYARGAGPVLEWVVMRLPWDPADSGWCPVTIDCVDCAIRSVSLIDVPRDELGSGERLELLDSSYTAIGLPEGRAVAISDQAGPDGMVQAIRDAWGDHRPTGESWWTHTAAALVVPSGAGWQQVFGSTFAWRTRAREKRAEPTRYYRVYLWCKADATPGEVWEWRVSASVSGDVVASGGFSHSTFQWLYLEDLEVEADADDELLVEVRQTAGTKSLEVIGFAYGEQEANDDLVLEVTATDRTGVLMGQTGLPAGVATWRAKVRVADFGPSTSIDVRIYDGAATLIAQQAITDGDWHALAGAGVSTGTSRLRLNGNVAGPPYHVVEVAEFSLVIAAVESMPDHDMDIPGVAAWNSLIKCTVAKVAAE